MHDDDELIHFRVLISTANVPQLVGTDITGDCRKPSIALSQARPKNKQTLPLRRVFESDTLGCDRYRNLKLSAVPYSTTHCACKYIPQYHQYPIYIFEFNKTVTRKRRKPMNHLVYVYVSKKNMTTNVAVRISYQISTNIDTMRNP